MGGTVTGGSVIGGTVIGGSVIGGTLTPGNVIGTVIGGSVIGGTVMGGRLIDGRTFAGLLVVVVRAVVLGWVVVVAPAGPPTVGTEVVVTMVDPMAVASEPGVIPAEIVGGAAPATGSCRPFGTVDSIDDEEVVVGAARPSVGVVPSALSRQQRRRGECRDDRRGERDKTDARRRDRVAAPRPQRLLCRRDT
jgi:hypothetical protein